MENITYFKYRSLENLERFLSIIIDRKLYGALYSEMNDPMEGYYKYDPLVDKVLLNNLVAGKKNTYICSLSKKHDIGLMWTHYANENKGCCLEVEVTSKTWRQVEVEYRNNLPEINEHTTVEDILQAKAKMWSYEEEVRFLSPEMISKKGMSRPQLSVKIIKIYVGCSVDASRFTYFKKIIKALDPNIEVVKMRKDQLNYGYKYA